MTKNEGALLTEYLLGSDLPEERLLAIWSELRNRFSLLCGDPPPWRWLPDLARWLIMEAATDPTFQPICFHCDWSLQHFPEAGDLVSMDYLSRSPQVISTSYNQMIEDLVAVAYHQAGLHSVGTTGLWFQTGEVPDED